MRQEKGWIDIPLINDQGTSTDSVTTGPCGTTVGTETFALERGARTTVNVDIRQSDPRDAGHELSRPAGARIGPAIQGF